MGVGEWVVGFYACMHTEHTPPDRDSSLDTVGRYGINSLVPHLKFTAGPYVRTTKTLAGAGAGANYIAQ